MVNCCCVGTMWACKCGWYTWLFSYVITCRRWQHCCTWLIVWFNHNYGFVSVVNTRYYCRNDGNLLCIGRWNTIRLWNCWLSWEGHLYVRHLPYTVLRPADALMWSHVLQGAYLLCIECQQVCTLPTHRCRGGTQLHVVGDGWLLHSEVHWENPTFRTG